MAIINFRPGGAMIAGGSRPNIIAPRVQPVERQRAKIIAQRVGTKADVVSVQSASIGGALKGAITGFVASGGNPGAAVTGGILGALRNGGSTPAPTPLVGPTLQTCPTGFRLNPATGQCETVGVLGGIQRLAPGGKSGTLTDVTGQATVGAFGLPALVPSQVGTITRNDGVVSPILRCPRRMVLGTDDLCYPKALLGRRSKFRKWRAPVRPPVSSADAAAIRRAERARDRVKELAMDVGFKVKRK